MKKRILTIGARKQILVPFSQALEQAGFQADWTDRLTDVEGVLAAFPPDTCDVVCFGRGVTNPHKQRFMAGFLAGNPGIAFVEGLAPITELLVDQVRLAVRPAELPAPVVNLADDALRLTGVEPGLLVVTAYTLNLFFQSSRKEVFRQAVQTGTVHVPLGRKSKETFVVVTLDEAVMAVLRRE